MELVGDDPESRFGLLHIEFVLFQIYSTLAETFDCHDADATYSRLDCQVLNSIPYESFRMRLCLQELYRL